MNYDYDNDRNNYESYYYHLSLFFTIITVEAISFIIIINISTLAFNDNCYLHYHNQCDIFSVIYCHY